MPNLTFFTNRYRLLRGFFFGDCYRCNVFLNINFSNLSFLTRFQNESYATLISFHQKILTDLPGKKVRIKLNQK